MKQKLNTKRKNIPKLQTKSLRKAAFHISQVKYSVLRKCECNAHAIPLTAETVVVGLELVHGLGPDPI